MASRRIRDPVGNALLLLHTGAMWFVFSPVVLLFQALPQDRSTIRIVPA